MGCNKNHFEALCPSIFFINELDKDIEEMLLKHVDDNKLTNALKKGKK